MTRLAGGEFDEVDVLAARIIGPWLDGVEGIPAKTALKYARQWAADGKERMLAAGYPDHQAEAVTTFALAAFADTVEPKEGGGRTDERAS